MDTTTLMWIGVGLLIGLVIAGIVYGVMRHRRREHLKDRFGPEYDRAVQRADSRREAESALSEREKRAEEFDLRPLTTDERRRIGDEIETAQARFVDDPSGATAAMDRIVGEVMQARGYPDGDHQRRAEDLSVHHPESVEDYRTASGVARGDYSRATTEDHRQALIRLRELAETLIEAGGEAEGEDRPADRTVFLDEHEQSRR